MSRLVLAKRDTLEGKSVWTAYSRYNRCNTVIARTKALAKSRRLNVKLTTVGLTDEMLARLFVFVLLDTKVGRKMPQA